MNKHSIKITKNKELFLVLLGIWGVFLLFNMYMPTIRADDMVYASRLDKLGYLGASIEHYKTWSSRIIVELFLMFFSKHFALWKLLNSMVMVGTVVLLCKYVFEKINVKNLLLVFSIYCLVPMTVMGETGWRATTLNYQWPVAFSLLAFYPFFQVLRGEEITRKIYWLSIPLLIFSTNQEQVNACFFVLTSIVSLYLIVNGRYSYKLSVFSIISLAELIFSLTTPGNALRAVHEINRWFPEYKNFNFLNKLDLGISSFGKPFFLDMNILFLLLFSLVFILVYRKHQNYYVRILTALPLFLNLTIYFGNTMGQSFTYVSGNKRAMIWSSSNLNNLFTGLGTKLSLFYPGTWIATLVVLGLLICLIVGIYLSFDNKKTAILLVILMIMGFCSRVIMGFSPTVWASGMRTYYILYIVIVLLVLMGVKELMKSMSLQKNELLRFGLTMLGICTLILTVMSK
ncbi:DUF6056 family protein [Enterococcus sp. DIV0660C]|uniref:DUF6056 family protein n=1 Tax=Enterococcus sp. DIV0660C TaxID=2230880 RepID=UPI001A8D62C3|nr:DUF6056 family protein [Enterococcus sp. DIV0660C]MBO0432069.1 hypothetical protein [Enterococcus sp. DIV0660C]